MRKFLTIILLLGLITNVKSQGSYGGGGSGGTNYVARTNGIEYGDMTIKSAGTSIFTTPGWIKMTNQTGIAWGGGSGLFDQASMWYNANHDAQGGELQFGSSHNFSFTDGGNGSATALSHFGASLANHGVWIYQTDFTPLVGTPLGYSKFNGFRADYWNVGLASSMPHYAGWRYEIQDNTTTNGALVWYGKMRGFSQAQLVDEVANTTTANLNDSGTWSMTGLNVTNSANLGIGGASGTTLVKMGNNAASGITAPELTIQSGVGAVSSFVTVGRLSSTSGDNTRFRVQARDGTVQFEVSAGGGAGGYWNSGGFSFGKSTTANAGVDASATDILYQAHIQSKTANYTVTTADSGTHFDNAGASGAMTNTLPTAVPGLIYSFTVGAQQVYAIKASGTDVLYYTTVTSTAGGLIYSQNVGNTIGRSITLVCHVSGKWFTESLVDGWSLF